MGGPRYLFLGRRRVSLGVGWQVAGLGGFLVGREVRVVERVPRLSNDDGKEASVARPWVADLHLDGQFRRLILQYFLRPPRWKAVDSGEGVRSVGGRWAASADGGYICPRCWVLA